MSAAAGPNDLEHTEVILDDTGIGSDEHEDQDETTVAIERSMDGSFFVKSDFEHYTKRPRSHTFENMCLYDFISRVRIKKDTSCRDTPKDKHLDPGHTLFKSHVAILYRRPRTVTFSGKAIPLAFPHQPKYEDCCRAFLILFKPWRCLQDLKGVRDSWIKSHETYTYPTELKERQACLMALHTGKLAVEKHQALLRSQQQPQGVGMPHLIGLDIADKEHEWLIQGYKHNLLTLDELMNDELGGLESETFDDGLAQQSLQPYRREEIAAAERLAQYLQTAGSVEEDPPADGVVRLIDGESLKGLQDQFRNLYTRLNREEAENTVNTDADTDMLSVPTSVDVKKAFLSKNRQTEASLNYASLVATVKDHYEAVAQQHGLNPAQAASLRLLARQICIGAYGKPLLHYVGGVGGTGKSLVIHAMKELLARCDMSDAYHCAAPTGCAATLIGGNTLHFLCKISTAQKKEIAQVEPRDVRRWENVHFLIIDEISMVGAGTLHHVDHFFRVLRPHLRDVPFAGMNIICFGDFGQLAPVKQIPIYSKTFENVSASAMGQQKPNAWNAQGVLAWRQFEDVILLTENWRQKKDPAYASMLMRIRKGHNCRERRAGCDGECNRKDFAMLNSVLLESSSFYNAADFVDAPIIVGTKSLRDQINTLKARLHAQRMGVTDYVYFADDTYTGGKQQMDARVRIMLSRLAANKVDDMLGELPLFPGMQVMLVENQCTPIGLVNGAVGIVHSIDFTLDVLNRKVAKCAYVAFRNVEAPSIPNVPPGTFPITPKSKAFRYHKDQHSDVIPFSRKQLPLVPAYAMTDYKSQGQTIKKAIVDLATSQSLSGVYVMLSRVSSIRDIIVLRPFGMDRIMHSCNSKGEVYVDDKGHGLLDELDRLDKVCHTNLNWNLEDTL